MLIKDAIPPHYPVHPLILVIPVQTFYQELAPELKIKRDEYTIDDGKEQLGRYLDRLGLNEGYLVIFDPAEKDWAEKLYYNSIPMGDKTIIMVGL